MISGVDGGLYGVVSNFVRQIAVNYADDAIDARINAYWSALSTQEKLAAPDEYLARYGHLLPPDMVEGGAAVVRGSFPAVLKAHARMLKELTRVGRG